MATWTLNDTALADFGIESLTLRQSSRTAAVCTFTAPAATPGASPALADGLAITIKQGETVRFAGAIRRHTHAHSPAEGLYTYHATDAWDDLARLVYRQPWAVAGGGDDQNSTFVRLYQDRDGDRISAEAQIQAIVTYAASRGISLQSGAISLDSGGDTPAPLRPPWETRQDITCAEAVRAVLDWAPDAIAWIDPSTSPASLRVIRSADATATAVDISAAANRPANLQVDSRPDLSAPGVRIIYELTGIEGRTFETDEAGSPDTLGAIEQTIVLDYQPSPGRPTQDVVTEPLGDPDTLAWWQARFPWLPDAAELTGVAITPANEDGLARVLLEGTLQPWMQPTGKAVASVITCTAAYYDSTGEMRVTAQPLEVPLTLTNLRTRRYSGPPDPSWRESAPGGLAANLYASVATVPHEGTIAWDGADCDARGLALGARLTLSGARAAWATMLAPVQQVTWRVETGRVEIAFGPPEHIAPHDWLELIRANRRRHFTFRPSNRRDTADDPDLPDEDDADPAIPATPQQTPTAGAGGVASMIIRARATDSEPRIDLNPADAEDDEHLRPRLMHFTAPDGSRYSARIIAAEPSDADEDDGPGGEDPPEIPPCGHPGNFPGAGGTGDPDEQTHPGDTYTSPDHDTPSETDHPGDYPSPPCADDA